MERIEQRDVEILVHTTAPSRGTDDTRYRAQARAYLDFKPVTKNSLQIEADESTSYSQSQIPGQVSLEAALSTQEERESRASYRPSDDDGDHGNSASRASFQSTIPEDTGERSQFLDSPELSFNSVLDNISSPVFRGGVTRPAGRPQQQNTQASLAPSWEKPRSFVSDSQSDKQNYKPAPSPALVLEQYMQRIQESDSRALNRGEIEQDVPRSQHGRVVVPSNRDEEMINFTSSTDLLSSPSPDKSNPAARNLHVKAIARNPTSSTHDFAITSTNITKPGGNSPSSSAPVNSSGNSLPSLSPFNWRPIKQKPVPPTPNLANPPVPVTSPNLDDKPIPNSNIPTSSLDLPSREWNTIYEIRPNPPPTSTMDLTPSMLVTPELQKLAARMNLELRFRPASQSRELRPMERGYWDVDCKLLEPDLRRRCWSYLGNFISRDLAGWGVWAVRTAGRGQVQGQAEGPEQGDEGFKIRIYCWGIVVGHVYLLLYLASEGRIKGAGARWVGGDGKPIIEMSIS